VLIAPIRDEDGREIMGRHRIRYDYLVLAVGSVSNDFRHQGRGPSIASSWTAGCRPTVSAPSCWTIA